MPRCCSAGRVSKPRLAVSTVFMAPPDNRLLILDPSLNRP